MVPVIFLMDSMWVLVVFLILVLTAALGYVGYQRYKKCTSNCTTCDGTCKKCDTGYGTKLDGTPASDGTCPAYYISTHGVDYKGGDIGSGLIVTDSDDCVKKCQMDSACVAGVYGSKTNICWLKSKLDPTTKFASTYDLLTPVST